MTNTNEECFGKEGYDLMGAVFEVHREWTDRILSGDYQLDRSGNSHPVAQSQPTVASIVRSGSSSDSLKPTSKNRLEIHCAQSGVT